MYNPYDLLQILVNGQELTGRPIEFDSEVANHQTMENAFGNPVKPSKISTVCPDCGQGLEFEITLGNPPFPTLEVACYHCHPDIKPILTDPFMNPLEEGRIGEHELDPLLHDPNQQVVEGDDDESSVADRLEFPLDEEVNEEQVMVGDPAMFSEATEDAGKAPEDETPSEPKTAKKAAKKPKKAAKKAKKKPAKKTAKKKVPIEPADGLTEEVDIEDDDLVEQE